MRSPFDLRGSVTDRLLRLGAAALFVVIALSLAIWFVERYWPLLLAAVIFATAIWLIVRILRARRDPWR